MWEERQIIYFFIFAKRDTYTNVTHLQATEVNLAKCMIQFDSQSGIKLQLTVLCLVLSKSKPQGYNAHKLLNL